MSQPNLNEDLNIIANSNLEITYMDGDLNIIQALDDEPNDVGGLTSAELKAKFDEAGNTIKTYINGTLIPEILTEEATEAARAAAEEQRETNEAQRIANENARIAAEQDRVNETNGIVAQANQAAQSWAVGGTGTREGEDTNNAKYWAEQAHAAAGGGVMTFNGRNGAVVPQAGDYNAEQVGAIPSSEKGAASGVATLGTDGKVPAGQLPEISSVKTYTAIIGTTWTENEDTGVKSQSVPITGVLAKHTAKVDHAYTGDGTSDGYAVFVEAENQYLTYITNGYAETYDGGITFYIFGDAPTVSIPIVVEVA